VATNCRLAISSFSILLFLLLASPAIHTQPIGVQLSTHFGVHPGDTLQLSIIMQSPRQLGGVDFKIHYIDSVFRPISAQQDSGLKHWEWFSPSYDSVDATVRVVAIADLPFPPHPDPADFYPNGSIASLKFQVLSTWSQDSSLVPFRFYWGSCGDNACSNVVGDTLLIIDQLRNYGENLIWDETDNVHFPEASRPPHIGVVDSCQQAASKLQFVLDLRDGFAANYVICGNADRNLTLDISDAVYVVSYIFSGGPAPLPLLSGDTDCSGGVDVSDVVYLIGYIFGGGPSPCNCH
jgi:hypothetical protein